MTLTHNRAALLAGVFITLLWGGVMLYFYGSGRIVNYLTTDAFFREQVLIAGLVLVVLALFNLLTAHQQIGDGGCCHEEGHDHAHAHDHAHGHAHEHGHGHGHGHGGSDGHDHDSVFAGGVVAALLLTLPMGLAAALTPDRFSARAIENKMSLEASPESMGLAAAGSFANRPSAREVAVRAGDPAVEGEAGAAAGGEGDGGGDDTPDYGSFTLADLDQLVDKSAAGNYMIKVVELFYTAGDEEIQNVLGGLPVETEGQIIIDKKRDPSGRRLRVFRLYVECCAADARPVSVGVELAEDTPGLREMAWYRITGNAAYHKEKGLTVPVIEAASLEEIPEPKERMAY